MQFNEIGAQHFAWVEAMGWHNKTVLESLALIGSEIGETAAECLTGTPTEAFGEELADIVLRTVDLAHDKGIDLDAAVATAQVAWRTGSLLEDFAELWVDFATWANAARKAQLGDDFTQAMARVMRRVLDLAERHHVDLRANVLRKMEINLSRGTRGRII